MISKRLARQAGHRRKFLCVVDDSPECDRAVLFAATRATRTDGGLVLVYVVPPGDFQHWRGVEAMMRADAEAEAATRLDEAAGWARAFAGIEAERIVREGKTAEAVTALIDEDPDISILVLAAATGSDGPGPLIAAIAAHATGEFPIPVTIVPGHLDDEDIVALT